MKKRNLLKMFTVSALTSTMILSNCGMYSTMVVQAEENEIIENEDVDTDDVEATTNKLNISSLDATIQAFVDDNEIFGTEENDVFTYEVETGKTVYFTVTSTNDGTIKVTRMNSETGCDEEIAPEEDGRYKVEINNDECITVTSTKEEEPEEEPDEDPVEEPDQTEDYSSAHITTQTIKSDDSGYQWEDSNVQSNSTEEDVQEALQLQEAASQTQVDSLQDPYANGGSHKIAKGGLNALFTSIASGKPGKFIGWAAGTIFEQIFGSDEADQAAQVNQTLNDINNKQNQIINQLNQMESRLQKIQETVTDISEEQKIENIRNDLNVVTTYRVKLETFLNTVKTLDADHQGSDREERFYKDALRRLDTTTLNNIMDYGNALITKGTNTNHSSFYVVSTLISLEDFGWESEMQQMQTNQNSALVAPYLEAVSYVIALKGYALAHLEEGSDEYIFTSNDIKVLQEQVNEIKAEMEKNEIQDRPQGQIAFYVKPGKVMLLSSKLRFQTDENQKLTYDRNRLTDFENIRKQWQIERYNDSFDRFLQCKERIQTEILSKQTYLASISTSYQEIIAKNLATMDHDGLEGTELLKELGFEVKYESDTLAIFTRQGCVNYPYEKKVNGKSKSFVVYTYEIGGSNNDKVTSTSFKYTDANGNVLDKMECDQKCMISFMADTDWQTNKDYIEQFLEDYRTDTVA